MFRAAEITQVQRIIAAGESASLIGASGVGKSNLFKHLLDHDVQQTMFGKDAPNYLVMRVDAHYVADLSLRSIYSLLLDQLELLGDSADYYDIDPTVFDKITAHHDKMLDAGKDVLKVQRHFTLAIRQLISDRKRKLVLLLDQFEEFWIDAPLRLFLNLRGLRDAYKPRISFLTFTRNGLPLLAKMDHAREKFHELLAPNLIGVKPYNSADSRAMLTAIAGRYDIDLTAERIETLIQQCGGHAGLLRAALLAGNKQSANVRREAQKIYDSLMPEEQAAIYQLAHNSPQFDKSSTRWLQVKGLIDPDRRLFSPLFATHIRTFASPVQLGITYDPKNTRRITINGIQTDALTILEHRVFFVLFQDADAIISRDDIATGGWGSPDGVTDDVITQVIRRIREKIAPIMKATDIIETVRGEGYRFNSLT